MCGILGIIDPQRNVAADLYRGTLALHHRGQDAVGIATVNELWNGCFGYHVRKGVGLLAEVFKDVNLSEELPGFVGTSHLRYGTQGGKTVQEAQPFNGFVHNGNVINVAELRSTLSKKYPIISSSDSEVLMYLLIDNIRDKNNSDDILNSVKHLMEKVNGAYSVITVIGDGNLLAFRDPKGIRPLIMGHLGNAVAFASESVALDTLNYRIERDVKPGEAILVTRTGVIINRQLITTERTHCVFEYIYLARPESIIDGLNVGEVRRNLGMELPVLDQHVDMVCDIPTSSEDAAFEYATKIDRPYRRGIRKNHYTQRSFIGPNDAVRKQTVRLKFHIDKVTVAGKTLALVDDSIVRGNTAKQIVRRLRNKNVKAVHLISAAPPIRYPCHYGVNMSCSEEFIANQMPVEQLVRFFNVDSLTYQTVDGMLRAVKNHPVCMACFDNQYPTKIEPLN